MNLHFFQKTYSLQIVVALCLSIFTSSCKDHTLRIKLDAPPTNSPVIHGINKLKELQAKGSIQFVDQGADLIVTTILDSINLPSEGFEIQVNKKHVTISGGGATGLMYGLFDIKEQLENGTGTIESKKEVPHLDFRAVKFNLPWDPYRSSKLLRGHTETCRDTLFWTDFLDMMAWNRFNKLTLWNLHPFNYMVRTEKYPEACSFTDEELADWQEFWHTLFRMAKDRGIETYLVNWNIFVPREFAIKHDVAKNLHDKRSSGGPGDTAEVIKDYMMESVRATIDTYPNLTGLGITLGEGMGGMTAEEREQWLLDSFIAGVRQAKRKIKFIHRVPLSAGESSAGSTSASVEMMTRQTLDTLTCFDGPMNIELKFNWSHGHSSTKLVKVHGGKLTDTYWNPLPKNYYLAWMIRNEDFFILRWGQPDFIREHIAQNVHPYVNGYYLGSEAYIPANDYFTSLPGTSYKYAFERQWMFYKVWGRLLYNPQTPDAVFENAFENRFQGLGKTLFAAQSKTSKVPLVIASFFNGWWDFTLYSEGMLGFNEQEPPAIKLLSLNTMIERAPLEPDYMSIKDFVANNKQDAPGKITPFELADSVDTFCASALKETTGIDPGQNTDLVYELADIQAWAYLGHYFSNKLRAAVAYKTYLETSDKKQHKLAIEWLQKACFSWDALVKVTEPVYQPMPISHMGYRRSDNLFHWSIVQEQVNAELEWLENVD